MLTGVLYCVYVYHKKKGLIMTTRMVVRIDPDLKAKVNNLAKVERKNVTKLLYAFLDPLLTNMLMCSDVWGYRMSVSWKSC